MTLSQLSTSKLLEFSGVHLLQTKNPKILLSEFVALFGGTLNQIAKIKGVLLGFCRRRPKLCVFILLVMLYSVVYSGEENELQYDEREIKFSAPNQTLWEELLELPPNMINLTYPSIAPTAKLLIVVSLLPRMFSRRQEIRSLWGSSPNNTVVQDELVSILFVVTQNNFSDAAIGRENEIYEDILVVRGQESYFRLVYKLLLAFRWISTYYPHVHVAKIDSDVVLNVNRLYWAVTKEAKRRNCFAMGYLFKGSKPQRDPLNKWYIPKSVYPPEYLPTYVNGPLYVLSVAAVKAILGEAPKHPVFEVEDAFFTGALAEAAGVGRLQMQGVSYVMPKVQRCDKEGRPTVIAYPTHGMKIEMKLAHEQMKKIPCRTLYHFIFHPFSTYFF